MSLKSPLQPVMRQRFRAFHLLSQDEGEAYTEYEDISYTSRRETPKGRSESSSKYRHGNNRLKEYLMDATSDPRQIRLPFTAKQVGIYHEVLLSGSENLRRRRELLQALQEHYKGPFEGPIRDGQAWMNVERYKQWRARAVRSSRRKKTRCLKKGKTVRRSSSRVSLASSDTTVSLAADGLLNTSPATLVRCPTPPLARDLLVGYLENEPFIYPGFMQKLDMSNPFFHDPSAGRIRSNLREAERTMVRHERLGDNAELVPERVLPHTMSLIKASRSASFSGDLSASSWENTDDESSLSENLVPMDFRTEETVRSSVLDRDGAFRGGRLTRPKFRVATGDGQPDRYTPLMTRFAVAVDEGIEEAQATGDVRPRIRYRRPRIQPTPASGPIPDSDNAVRGYPLLPEYPCLFPRHLQGPLMTGVEEEYVRHHCWWPAGVSYKTLAPFQMSLQEAWDIGAKGCFAQITIFPASGSVNARTFLRFLVMDGTEDSAFISYYSGSEVKFRRYKRPKYLGNINRFDLQHGYWNLPEKELRLYNSSIFHTSSSRPCEMVIQNLTAQFMIAMIVCLRHANALHQIARIRRKRYFTRRYDMEIGYLKALRNVLIGTKDALRDISPNSVY